MNNIEKDLNYFVIGDKVVRINSPLGIVSVGSIGVVVSFNSRSMAVRFYCDSGNLHNCYARNAELEHVFNSPLNQALR